MSATDLISQAAGGSPVSPHDGVRALLAPRSIAVVGATPRVEALGGRPLVNLTTHGYTGAVYPINPRYDSILGMRCYPELAALPESPDLVLVLLAADRVDETLEQAARVNARCALVFSAGFAESGDEGKSRQARLRAYRDRGLRVCGPNCNGVFSVVNRTALGFSPAFEAAARSGGLALISQSGGVSTCVASRGMEAGVGFSHIIASGNEADLELADYVEFLLDDPQTTAFSLFIEGFKDAPRFMRLAQEALRRGKPIVAMKMGRSQASRRVAMSHTGSLTGPSDVIEGALRQQGVILVDSLDRLFGTASLFATGKRPRTGQVAVASLSGGMAGIVADTCETAGVPLATFSTPTSQALAAQLPGVANLDNPLDVTGQVVNEPERWRACLDALNADPDVGLLATVLSITANRIERRFVRDLIEAAATTDVAQLCIWPSSSPAGSGFDDLRDGAVPIFTRAEDAVLTIRAWQDYWQSRSARLASLDAGPTQPPTIDLDALDDWSILRRAGVPLANMAVVNSHEALDAALDRMHLPVAMKIQSAHLPHKTEVNALRLGIEDRQQARKAFDELAKIAPGELRDPDRASLVLQEMVVGRREIMVGLKHEPGLGMAIVLGQGGIFAEMHHDRAVRMLPLSDFDVREMIAELRAAPMLADFRGMSAVRPGLLERIVQDVARLGQAAASQILELDINPLIVDDTGTSIQAVDVLVVRRQAHCRKDTHS